MKNNNRIKGVVLFMLLALAGLANAQQWQELHTGVTEDLYDICCIDENTVFVCGQNGVILKTEDGGMTWQEKHRNPDWEIISIKFADENIGYGLVTCNYSYPRFLLKTIDSGETWFRVNTEEYVPTTRFSEYRYDDPLELFLAGKPFELFVLNADTLFIRHGAAIDRSIDGGVSSVRYELGFFEVIGNIGIGIKGEYFEDNFGWVIGYANENQNTLRIMKTEDCGDNWDNIANYEFSALHIAAVYSGKDGHARIFGRFFDLNSSSETYNVIETADGFEHITMYLTEGENIGGMQFSDIDFDSQEHGCYICSINWDKEFYSDSHAYISNDSGLSWTEVPYGIYEKMFVYSVAATDSTFFIASQKGVLYKFDSSPYQGVEDDHLEVSIFPNPVEKLLEIRTKNPQKIEIFDYLGRKIIETAAKQNHLVVDVSKFDSGVYFIVISDLNGIKQTKKIVKL